MWVKTLRSLFYNSFCPATATARKDSFWQALPVVRRSHLGSVAFKAPKRETLRSTFRQTNAMMGSGAKAPAAGGPYFAATLKGDQFAILASSDTI